LLSGAARSCWRPGFADNRRFYGYDVSGLIPPPSPRDPADVHARYEEIAGGRSRGIGGDTYYGYVDDLYGQVVASFERHGVPVDGERINLSRGRFEETLRPDRAIAVAHIDCDWHDPVALCLERVWQHLVVDGRIVLDDYNDWGGCRVATDAFLGQHPDAVVAQRVPTVVIQRA
jgi:O-methyltransferase